MIKYEYYRPGRYDWIYPEIKLIDCEKESIITLDSESGESEQYANKHKWLEDTIERGYLQREPLYETPVGRELLLMKYPNLKEYI